jgi:hypothetical protein
MWEGAGENGSKKRYTRDKLYSLKFHKNIFSTASNWDRIHISENYSGLFL